MNEARKLAAMANGIGWTGRTATGIIRTIREPPPGDETQSMKPSRRTRRHLGLLLTFVVFAHFGVGHRDVPTWVLCFGADGHVAVEPMHSPHAPVDQAAVAGHIAEPDFPAAISGEGSCWDIPVIREDHGAHKPCLESERPIPDARLYAPPTLVLKLIPFDEMARKAAFVTTASPSIDSRLPARRGVVLPI